LKPRKSGDFAWVEHMIKSMAARTGRMAVVLPHGALFRMGVEGKIRRHILEMDALEAVIGLGPNLFYGTGLAACLLVLRAGKAAERKRKVLFIDAARLFKRGRNQNTLEPERAGQIYALYRNYESVEGLARLATLDEIAENEWNLNIPRYVEPVAEAEIFSVEDALANLNSSLKEAYDAEERLRGLLKASGLY
jgi:type I restriction enzyme M protein